MMRMNSVADNQCYNAFYLILVEGNAHSDGGSLYVRISPSDISNPD
jgi:hypothetical protein